MSKYKPLADMVAPDVKDWKLVAENVKVSFQKHMPKEYKGKKYRTHPPFGLPRRSRART